MPYLYQMPFNSTSTSASGLHFNFNFNFRLAALHYPITGGPGHAHDAGP